MGLSRTAKYYRDNPDARKKHQETSKKHAAKPAARRKRAQCNAYNREQNTYGNGDGLDASHKGFKIFGFEKQSTNRARGGAKKK